MNEEKRKHLDMIIGTLTRGQSIPTNDGLKSEVADILLSDLTESISRNADSADRLSKALIALEVIAVIIAAFALWFQVFK